MEQKVVCTLGRDKPDRFVACNTMTNSENCQRCGWEETEMQRRKAAIRAVWKKPYMETRKYCLKLRKERKENG